jgi:AcrR family transcriptional regulator
MPGTSEPGTRPYRMVHRAEAFAETRQAILDAANEIRDPRTPLSVVADKAGVSERTVLRHFGSRDGLVAAAIAEGTKRDEAERFAAPAGDVAGAVASLVGHYETAGDRILRLLAEEGADRKIDEILAGGRTIHWRWVEEKLGPLLEDRPGPARHRRLAQLAAICDVYTWKVMRRDGGLDRTGTERSIRELIEAVIRPQKGPAR